MCTSYFILEPENMEDSSKNRNDEENSINSATESQLNINNDVLNESLEVFAKTYNLTAQNVKNILYHIIKNPQTFSTLFGNDLEAIATLRMTRSRQRELERIAQVKLGIELKPVNATRTFLDVEYDENDEDDTDYRPDENEADDADDGNESDFPEFNASWGELIEEEEVANNETAFEEPQLLTRIDNPDYLEFLKSVATPDGDALLSDDDMDYDDEFRIFQQELDMIEEEEFRMDRTTRIPRWELDALRQDWVSDDYGRVKSTSRLDSTMADGEKEVSPKNAEQNHVGQTLAESTNAVIQSSASETADIRNNVAAASKSTEDNDDVVEVFASVLAPTITATNTAVIAGGSSFLLAEHVDFSAIELDILRVQMEKHVQLLTQNAVGCYNVDGLAQVRNQSLEMLYELKTEFNDRNSMSYISNLDDAIYSADDIELWQNAELPSSSYYLSPSNEVIWVLSLCKALRYPQFVPGVRMQYFVTAQSAFLPSEQILLMLALHELHHVRHSSWYRANGKYQLIADYFLPTRTVQQIRYHLKNLHNSTSYLPINDIVLEAQRTGALNAKFMLDAVGHNAQTMPPIMWPTKFQPEWIKMSGIQQAHHTLAAERAKEVVDDEEIQVDECVESENENKSSNQQQPDAFVDGDSREPDCGDEPPAASGKDIASVADKNETSMSNASSMDTRKQKSRRKIRVEKCTERLGNQKVREEILTAVMETVNHDLKQRLFMHEDKLKEVQAIISRTDLSVAQLLSRTLSGEQHANTLALLAALAPDKEFANNLSILRNSLRKAYEKGLEMLVNSHAYLTGCRSAQSLRNAFRNVREAADWASNEEFARRVKHHFGSRDDDPLWQLLRREIPHEKFNEKVEDWQFEQIDMDTLQNLSDSTLKDTLAFESVNLPYKFDANDRGRLRLRHGRLTMEHDGRLKTVNVGFTSGNEADDAQKGTPSSSTSVSLWTREDDKILLTAFHEFDGDAQRAIDAFLARDGVAGRVGAPDVSLRLGFLIGMLHKVQSNIDPR